MGRRIAIEPLIPTGEPCERDGEPHGWVVTAYARRAVQERGDPLWTR